jgi:hypothetical protein
MIDTKPAGGAAVCCFETGTESLGRSADHVDGVVVDAGRAVLRCAHGQFVSMIGWLFVDMLVYLLAICEHDLMVISELNS